MAKNWTAHEAAKLLNGNITEENYEDVKDIFKRFPLFAKVAINVNNEGMLILQALPEYFTARKINKGLENIYNVGKSNDEDQNDLEYDSNEENVEEVEEKPSKKKIEKKSKKAKKEEPEEEEFNELEDDDEEEEEEVKPKKKEKKPIKKKAKKEVEEDDDDFDFDFED